MSVIGASGVGHIAADLAFGPMRAGTPPAELLLFPRAEATAQALHHARGVTVPADHAVLVAASTIVFLCVRRRVAVAAVVGRLAWLAGSLLLSHLAGTPGGANEVGLDELRQASNFSAWGTALELAMTRVAMLRQL